jgi:uncharacterized membrane protein
MGERTRTTTVTIAAPAARVWAVLTDVARWPDWTESVTEVRRLDDGEFRVGSQARIRQPGLRPATWTVDSIEPTAGFTWSTAAPGARVTAVHRITTASEGSVEVELTVVTRGALAGFVDRVYGKKTQRYIEMEAAGLRRTCEA